MPAILPIVAGAAGSALLSKLLDLAMSSGSSSPAIDEGSSVGGAGRVYEAGSEPVMAGGVKPSIVINSPNAEGTQPSSQSQTSNSAPQAASATAGNQQASVNVDDIAAQHRNEVMAAEAAGGNQVVAEDPATAPINGSDVLNALLAAAGASALGYAGSRAFSGNAKQGVPNVEPTVGTANASSPSKAVAVTGDNAVVDPNARPATSNVIDAEFTPVRDPLNIAGGDPTLQLAAPQQKLNAPQPQQGQQQVAGKQNNKALPPAQNKAIVLPDQTSGPTIQAESGVFDAAKPFQKINLQGKQFVVQDGMIFDGRTKAFRGEASKFLPKNQHGVARTLGILKRGLR